MNLHTRTLLCGNKVVILLYSRDGDCTKKSETKPNMRNDLVTKGICVSGEVLPRTASLQMAVVLNFNEKDSRKGSEAQRNAGFLFYRLITSAGIHGWIQLKVSTEPV